jgi:hypothetical protein
MAGNMHGIFTFLPALLAWSRDEGSEEGRRARRAYEISRNVPSRDINLFIVPAIDKVQDDVLAFQVQCFIEQQTTKPTYENIKIT